MHVISGQDLHLALMGFEIICCNFLGVVLISGQDLHPVSLLISKLVVGGGVDFERWCLVKMMFKKKIWLISLHLRQHRIHRNHIVCSCSLVVVFFFFF